MLNVKFRGKRKGGTEWLIGDLSHSENILGAVFIFPRENAPFNSPDWFEVEPSSIGMFTGLYDKDVKEIFGAIGDNGGDIVIDVSIKKSFEDARMVDFVYGSFGVKDFHLWEIPKLEIIGNATDNPELLEK